MFVMPKAVSIAIFVSIIIALGTALRWEVRRVLARRRTDGW